jgi:histidinol dehydrogenase
MRVIRFTDANFAGQLREVTAPSSLFDPVIEQRTRAILDDVQRRGDAALIELTERFDGAKLAADQLTVTQAEHMTASLKADASFRAAVTEAGANIAAFAKRSRRRGWEMKNSHGANVGEKFDPFQRVGIYIPGGTAPLVSTALMTITLARVAGCREIVVCTAYEIRARQHLHGAQERGVTDAGRPGLTPDAADARDRSSACAVEQAEVGEEQ